MWANKVVPCGINYKLKIQNLGVKSNFSNGIKCIKLETRKLGDKEEVNSLINTDPENLGQG